MASPWKNIAAGLAALAGLAGAGALWLVRRPLAQTQGALHLPGLEGDVEVLRDT